MSKLALRIEPNSRGGFNVVSARGLECGNLETHAAAVAWVEDNADDWPPDWRLWRRGNSKR